MPRLAFTPHSTLPKHTFIIKIYGSDHNGDLKYTHTIGPFNERGISIQHPKTQATLNDTIRLLTEAEDTLTYGALIPQGVPWPWDPYDDEECIGLHSFEVIHTDHDGKSYPVRILPTP